MKIASLFALGAYGMKHEKGRTDSFKIHIGGGAFDAGTSEALAKWAIRKCEKKVCAVWAWAKCPLGQEEFDKGSKLTQAPCCHKCWNKCPPYLARHKNKDKAAFANNEKRREIKDQIWKFLEEDIQCETTKLKNQFLNGEMSFEELSLQENEQLTDEDCDEDDQECIDNFERFALMQNDAGVNGGNAHNHPSADPSCGDSNGWYKCHGHSGAKCCKKGCLNQQEGESKQLCDACGCKGKCDHLHDLKNAFIKNKQLRCDLWEDEEEEEEEEEEE